MKYGILIISFLFFTSLNAQSFNLPEDVQFEEPADYAKQHDNVLAAVDWLRDSPIDEMVGKRKQINAYLLQWLTGSPDVSIALNMKTAEFGDCADCLMLFMGGWASHAIKNPGADDQAGTVAGLTAVMDFYQKNKSILGKNKAIEKWIKLTEKGKLEATVAKLIG